MRLSIAFCLAGVTTLMFACSDTAQPCQPGQQPAATRTPADRLVGQLARVHSHNDYLQPRPLLDALDAGVASVEVDVWLLGNTLRVGHWPWELQGTLQEMYLDVLQARVDATGSVLGDGRPFVLWVDIKERNPAYVRILRDVLAGYPMLSIFHPNRVEARAVTVVLSGDAFIKTQVVTSPDPVHATRDSNTYDPDDPPADPRWAFYALNYGDVVGWNGDGDVPPDTARTLACYMENARLDARPVRFYEVPENPAVWELLIAHGAAFIGTDHPATMAATLRNTP